MCLVGGMLPDIGRCLMPVLGNGRVHVSVWRERGVVAQSTAGASYSGSQAWASTCLPAVVQAQHGAACVVHGALPSMCTP